MFDYYRILKIAPDTPQKQLKAAYIQRLKQFHPDIYKGADATAKTQKINEAYQTLKDPQKRAAYDREWQAAHKRKNSGNSAKAGSGSYESGTAAENLSEAEILAEIIGGLNSRQRLLQQRIERIISGLYEDAARLSEARLPWALPRLRDAVRQDFISHKQRLLAENAAYYERFLPRISQNVSLAFIMQAKQKQQNFIIAHMDSALPQILAEIKTAGSGAASNAESGRSGGFAPQSDPAAPPPETQSTVLSAAFWWGFGLSVFLSYWPLMLCGLAFAFGARTKTKLRFLLGAMLGLTLHWLFLSR